MARPFWWMGAVAGAAWLASGVAVQTAPARGALHMPADVHVVSGEITPVAGLSSLHRLGLTVTDSPMGSSGLWGHAPDIAVPRLAASLSNIPEGFVLVTGADLYRVDCQGCHKADGTGTPTVVKSMIDPVRSMSPVMMLRRTQARGTAIDPAFARELASDSRKDIMDRLKHGGDKMPAFDHLQGVEIDALLAYLNALAGVPGPAPTQLIEEPAMHFGEHLVKGTCHTCHDATGPWPSPEALMNETVPPLASVLRHDSVGQVINKVRHGAPVVMGSLQLTYTGRMPVLSYLTDAEVEAAYEYLQQFPPQANAVAPQLAKGPTGATATTGRLK